MPITINKAKRVFKIEKTDIVLNDIDPEMPLEDVLGFYSMQYPQLTTAVYRGLNTRMIIWCIPLKQR